MNKCLCFNQLNGDTDSLLSPACLLYFLLFPHSTLLPPHRIRPGMRLENAGAAMQIHFHIADIRDTAASQKSIFTALFIYHQLGARLNTRAEALASSHPGQFHHFRG